MHGSVDAAFSGLAENVEIMIRECDEAVSAKSQIFKYDSNHSVGGAPGPASY